MKNLIEKLNKKFDEYHNEQLRIDDYQNPDYYLFMGKASAIGELLDELKIENNISNEIVDDDFKEWADWFCKTVNHNTEIKYLNNYFSKEMAFEDFRRTNKDKRWLTTKFKKQLEAYCLMNNYIFNPISMQNLSGRIIQRMEGKTQEVYYIQTKTNTP